MPQNTLTLPDTFEISLSTNLCAKLGWQAGQELAFIPKGSGVLLMAVPDVIALIGIAKGANVENIRER